MISWACLLLLIAVSCLFPSIFFFFTFSLFFPLSLREWFLCFAKICGGVERGFKCNNPPPLFFFFFFWWILVLFSASLWWRQGSFKPGSAHGRLPSQRCPLSSVLACRRKRGWGSSLTDPVMPRKAYVSTHAGFLTGPLVGDVGAIRKRISFLAGGSPQSAQSQFIAEGPPFAPFCATLGQRVKIFSIISV